MGVTFNRSDLEFILTQIGYAEGGQQPVNPHLAFGLRQVDGQFNSVVDGQPLYGAAAQIFPRLTNPVFQSAGSQTSYASTSGFVVDATPRIISNLIADQTAANPAAVAAAAAANAQLGDGYQSTLPGPDGILGTKDDVVSNTSTPAPVAADGSLFINNVTPDAGLSAPFNSLFTLFGQFFDHGLDLTAKGGSGTVMIPLQPDDPLYKAGSPTNFMVLSRATNQPGADGVLGTADDVHANTNLVTPFVDQNQTYTSHPSHQVFLREYIRGVDGQIHSTGRLLEGLRADGSRGEPTWADIKANALLLGIRLNDTIDVTNIPLVKVDAYGNFIADPVTGLAQLVTNLGADGKYGTEDDVVVHGARDANGIVTPITTENALRIGTAFLNDIAASANPLDQTTNKFLIPASDGIINDAAHPLAAGTFDVDLLNQHFIAGDGRANENIGLTAIHEVFHDEHNRLVEQTKDLVRAELAKGDTAFASAWTIAGANLADGIQDNEWNGERLFQAGKFGTETQYQHLVFEEFARKVSPAIHLFGNTNIHLDPSITEEFANAVYRFGHSMLDENINRYQLQAAWLDASGQPTAVNTGTPNPLAGTPVMDATGHPVLNAIGLIDAFTNPLAYASRGANAAGEIALGSVNQVGNEIDEFVTGTLRSNLLGLPLDLAALNIARGRDVGVAPLNLLRNQIYTASQDTSVKPYANWNEFGQFLKHEASLINFVAAYGTHASILAATTVDAKRAAALDLVTAGNNEANHGVGGVKGDAYDFLHGLGAYAHITDPAALKLNPNALHDASGNIPFWSTGDVTGLDHVDLWIGGLAEKQNLFGGLLGSTFDFIFRSQMENLQDGDRLYYLPRLEGTHFGTEIEGNSFAEMIMHNTGAQHVTASVFLTPEYTVETAAVDPGNTATWTHNPATGKLLLDASWVLNADGTHTKGSDGADIKSIHFLGDDNFLGNTMVLGGTAHDDVLVAGNADDDTVYGDGGNDRIDGGNGNDFLYGGAGNDIITDTAGDDTIHGDAGDDTINAGIGDDIVFGGDGNDTIDGGKGIDDILGGLGNDIIRAGEGDDEVLGNEGNDWIEGGQGGDVLTGDVGAPTGQLPLYGADDVLIGGSFVATGANGHPVFDAANAQSNNGGDKMLAFSGDDIMIGGGGFNTFRGGKGFDWSSFEFDGQGISIDMNRKDFVLDAPPLSPDAIRDVFIETEGLSGSSYNDELIGSNDAKADTTNELTNINLIQNLDTFFSPTAPVHFNSGNIILGGGGSDRISGGGGDDIIDGDASLHVSLQNGQIVREILDGGRTGDVDSAVYSDIAANYAIGTATADGRGWDGLDAEGFFSVVHLSVGAGGGGVTKVTNDGADKLRNIERLEFSDGVHTVNEFVPTLPLKNQLPLGTITISGTPVIGNILTATAALTDLDAKAGLQTVTNTTYQWEYLDPARAQWVPITGAISPTLKVADFEVGLPIRVVASFVDAKGFTESVVSAQTALVTTAPGVNTAPFIVPQQGQVGLPDTIVLDNVPVKLFLPVTTVFGDAQTPANALVYKVTLATGAALSTVGLTADLSGIATNGAILITGTLKAGVTGPFDIRVSATDGGPGTPLTVTDTFTVTVVHPSPGSLAVINGALQDGYIAGATVFMDSNGDGLHQSFEAQTITDVTGHFSLAGKPGALVAFGGPGAIDVATLLPFDGVYKAPAGSTVLTPLTTILSQGLEQGMALVDAHAALRTALQLNTGVDVTQIDPVAAMFDPDPVQKALAIHLFVTSTQILNTVALLQAASPNAAPLADITTLLLSGAVFDLTDPATVKSLVDLTGLFGPFADDAAKIVLASNTLVAAKADPALSPFDILTQVTAVSVVAKGMTADALSTAFSLEDMDSVASHFSGALLAAEVADATHRIGDVNGDGVNDASHAAPAGHVALVDPVSSVEENTNVQGGLKIADIVVVDVGASGDVVSLAGPDAASFAVRDGLLGKELWYVGANLDYEGGKTGYDVTVSVTNPANPGAAPFTAAMTLSVLNVNEAPVAVADAYTTAEDQALTVSAADGLLKNDTDPDNVPGVHQDSMTATLVSAPSHGILTLNADGSFVYTPNTNFNSSYDPATKQINPGPDSFTYTVSDGQLTSAPITVTLGVSPVDDLPTGSPGLAAALTGVTSATLTASAGTLADLDGIPATGPDAVAYAWAKSATGLGGWTAVAGTTAATLALSVPLGAGTPTYYEAVATYTDAGGTHASVASDTKAEIGTRFGDLLRDTVGTGAALQPISLLAGLSANDTYVVTHAGVTVMENVNGGTDTVETSLATYGLDANVENLSTISAAHGGSAAAVAYAWTGNALANTITTGAGDDRLDGGTGVDRMVGGLGNDTYVVDNIGDVVVEDPNAGTDTVVSAISYTLGANVENLTLTGIAPNSATGNAAGNVLTGNDGNNRLDGAAGADTMAGGLGNDTYVVDNAGDVVTEGVNAGTDTVLSAVSFTLGANVENLTLTGLGDTTATGNDANNILTGNAGNNLLDGRAGADRMVGGQGNDTYRVDNAGDVVVETLNGGTDTVLSTVSYTLSGDVENLTLTGLGPLSGTGNGLANLLTGNDGDNRLDGRTGVDTMAGGLGNDTYVVDNAGDVVIENAGAGTDEVVSSISYILGANLEKLTLTGVSNLTGTGNAADNVLTGNVGINLLDGGAGADTMAGGAGNDTYVVDNVGDVVIENAGAGTDTVRTSLISYTLGANVENLTYTGTGDFTGTGTATANVLTGGAGADILDGVRNTNGGFDTLVGAAGNDTYLVHNATDVVTEAVGGGTDTVEADVSFKLAANVENLTLVGTADINATGNTGNNIITGNTGANSMTGGTGSDIFVFGQNFGKDIVTDFTPGAAANHDTIDLSALTLALTGTTALQQFASFLSTYVSEVGAGATAHAQVKIGTDTIDLTGVHKTGLLVDDFRFH